jgi:hypothetical protein
LFGRRHLKLLEKISFFSDRFGAHRATFSA